MKEKHVEGRFKEEQLNPDKRIVSTDRRSLFSTFWQSCMEKSSKAKDKDKFTQMLSQYTEKTWEFQNAFNDFHDFLKNIPFVVVIGHWVEGVIVDKQIGENYLKGMKRLLDHDLIPLTSVKGTPLTLSDLRLAGHQETIENIRCVQLWTQAEKDDLVQCYVRFSCDLARYTFDYVPAGYDLDRKLTASRQIPYEVFYSFIQYLSKRDALLSKLLYFGAPSIDEVLSLQVKAIDKKTAHIKFSEPCQFPKHLILELLAHAKESPNSKGLVFANLRGEQVERAHLNQSFARASERMPENVKITPASLVRSSGDFRNSPGEKFRN